MPHSVSVCSLISARRSLPQVPTKPALTPRRATAAMAVATGPPPSMAIALKCEPSSQVGNSEMRMRMSSVAMPRPTTWMLLM